MSVYTTKPKRKSYDEAYRLAGISDRFVAIIIDTIIVGIIGGMFFAGTKSSLFGIGISSIIGVIYQWYFLTVHDGQTPGKMMMKIRVIKENGAPLTAAEAILRYIGYHVNTWVFSLGWIWAAVDERNQGWHDKIVRTYVVRTD